MPWHDNPDLKNFLTALICRINDNDANGGGLFSLPEAVHPESWFFTTGPQGVFYRSGDVDYSWSMNYSLHDLRSLAGPIQGFVPIVLLINPEEAQDNQAPRRAQIAIRLTEEILQYILVQPLNESRREFFNGQRPDLNMLRSNTYVTVKLRCRVPESIFDGFVYFIGRDATGNLSHSFQMDEDEFLVLSMSSYQINESDGNNARANASREIANEERRIVENNPNIQDFLGALIFRAYQILSSRTHVSAEYVPNFRLYNWSFSFILAEPSAAVFATRHAIESSLARLFESILNELIPASALDYFSVFLVPSIVVSDNSLMHIRFRVAYGAGRIIKRWELDNSLMNFIITELSILNPELRSIELNSWYATQIINDNTVYFVGRYDSGSFAHSFHIPYATCQSLVNAFVLLRMASNAASTTSVADAPIPPPYEDDGLLTLPSGIRCHPSEVSALYQQLAADLAVLRAHLPPAPTYLRGPTAE